MKVVLKPFLFMCTAFALVTCKDSSPNSELVAKRFAGFVDNRWKAYLNGEEFEKMWLDQLMFYTLCEASYRGIVPKEPKVKFRFDPESEKTLTILQMKASDHSATILIEVGQVQRRVVLHADGNRDNP